MTPDKKIPKGKIKEALTKNFENIKESLTPESLK